MRIEGVPFSVVDWAALPFSEHLGETGISRSRTMASGEYRTRIVEYSPGFRADHWCPKGHILIVLEGELLLRLSDGREFLLTGGMGMLAGDDQSNPHLACSKQGARVFIVD